MQLDPDSAVYRTAAEAFFNQVRGCRTEGPTGPGSACCMHDAYL